MVFYQPGVTPHNLPRDPFKVRVSVDRQTILHEYITLITSSKT